MNASQTIGWFNTMVTYSSKLLLVTMKMRIIKAILNDAASISMRFRSLKYIFFFLTIRTQVLS